MLDRPRAASEPHAGRRSRSRSASPADRGDGRIAFFFVLPAFIGFCVFAVYPTIRGIYLSFTDYYVLTPPTWTGLANFRKLAADEVFWSALRTTVYYVVFSVVIGTAVSLAIAVVLHRLTTSTLIRGLIIVPFLVSGVVAASAWSWLMDPQFGIVNKVITALGGSPIAFFESRSWVIPTVVLVGIWKSMGYNAILIFAGLQTIPGSLYEAARVDGASERSMFRFITLPLLRPILAMVVILSVIGSFQVFDVIQVTTKGGPANASNVLQMYIYNKAFSQFDFGYASTMSLALFAILMVVTFLQMRVLRASQVDAD